MSGLQSLYEQLILEHSRKRHGYCLAPHPAAESHQLNPTCGDEITLRLHVDEAGETVESLSWEGRGCVISTASASLLSALVEGSPVLQLGERIQRFRVLMQSRGAGDADDPMLGDAAALAGVSRYPLRVKCAMLAWVACEDGLARLPQSSSEPGAAVPASGQEAE